MMEEWLASDHPTDECTDSNMARRAPLVKLASDDTRVDRYASKLRAAQLNREAFEAAVRSLSADSALTVSDVIEIAQQYRGGGVRAASRKAALEVISKRFLELVRSQAQIKQAAKSRPW